MLFNYYVAYVKALMAKYKTWWEIKSYERKLNRCWEKILENKDTYSEEKLADVTERALKIEAGIAKSWQLYHDIYDF